MRIQNKFLFLACQAKNRERQSSGKQGDMTVRRRLARSRHGAAEASAMKSRPPDKREIQKKKSIHRLTDVSNMQDSCLVLLICPIRLTALEFDPTLRIVFTEETSFHIWNTTAAIKQQSSNDQAAPMNVLPKFNLNSRG
jgi:hypothetical protein